MRNTWNPTKEVMQYEKHSREAAEMRMISSLTSRSNRRQIQSVLTHLEPYKQELTSLSSISMVYDLQCFCERLVSAVKIATTYQDDINWSQRENQLCSVMMNDRHSRVTPEEVACKWNIGLQTTKDTLRVTTQFGIRTAIHPMTHWL